MSLSNRSMLVSLNQRLWQANASDRSLAQGVEQWKQAETRSMRVLKQLAPTDYLLPIKRVAALGRDQHSRLTLPGIHKGQQLLATKLFDEYALIQATIKDSFFQEVKRFEKIYPEIIEMAPKRLGKAYNAFDFPPVEKIASFFDYSHHFSPVPDGGNWLLDDVDNSDLIKLRNDIDNEKNDMFRDATKELFDRVHSVLSNLTDQIKSFKEGEANGGLLREATINAVKDMATLIPSMNIIGDPVLDTIGKEMADNFATISGKDLRENHAERSAIASAAARLIAKMGAQKT